MAKKKTDTPKNQISVDDIGPIHHFEFTIPEDGGVVVLKGRNGLGKSNVLRAVDALTTGYGKGDLRARDGAVAGQVQGFGVTLRVGRRATRSGELEVLALDSDRFSVIDVLAPPIKDPQAADTHRIKALVQLANKDKPDISL